MDNLFLKPSVDAEGKPALVRDPSTSTPLAADGEWKSNSTFWQRRLRDGDVVQADPPAEAPAEEAPPAPAEPKPRRSRG